MQVVSTAGHGGHGKSALVRALTGTEPGEPGAWTELPSGRRVAFVDVPGDERSVPAMLAGAAPAPAVLLAVAADEGWMPQTAEHLEALGALGVRSGVLAVTKADAADPRLALRLVRDKLAGTALRGMEAVPVSTVTGAGIDELTAALDRLAGRLPVPDPAAPVRLWADRAFTAGRQTVVTGTLTAGTVAVGDELLLMPAGERVRVRTIGCAGEPRTSVGGVSRVVLTLRDAGRVEAGMALVTPGAWTHTTCVDVRTRFGEASGRLARRMTLHLGSAAIPVGLRPLGPDTARLTLNTRVALHLGDTGVLRDPERRSIAGVSVLDVRPPTLVRRGAGAARARELASWPDRPDGTIVLRRHGVLRRSELSLMGCAPPEDAVALNGEWVADPAHWESLFERLAEETSRHAAASPRAPGIPLETVRLRLGLPARQLVTALVRPPLRVDAGRVYGPVPPPAPAPAPEPPATAIAATPPPPWAAGVQRLRADLADFPFDPPSPERLGELGLTGEVLAAAERAGAVVRIEDEDGDIVLLPGADREALRVLTGLPQPFKPAQAGEALGTSRRVAVALLRHLDRLGLTERRRAERS
ncbi:SelB C-terminal domain-containing protein [Actinomadura madurae]|uniref:selenocysteine-specific translation elongation factor n=1 Tax=Actinomadura madurae TaxID=1993 RepID=UPI002026EAB6|nr:selenocysteine-specific translation elongation factor [Actinomadura madurae]URN04268.1 SelB C-terminal domain-containing protein [Actinomadura madurae]